VNPLLDLLADNPLLLLFVVAATGTLAGRVRLGGFRLGIAAVLFAGLAAAALDPRLQLPEFVYIFGLALFVYTIGLASGPGFVAALRRQGLRDNLLALGAVGVGFGLTVAVAVALGLSATSAAGLFAGSLTNTPALAGVIESVRQTAPPESFERLAAEPVVAYSLAYPLGVVGVLAVVAVLQRAWRVDYAAEAARVPSSAGSARPIVTRTVRVTREAGRVADVVEHAGREVSIVRVLHADDVRLASADTALHAGDLVSVVGADEDVRRVAEEFGVITPQHLELDRRSLDFRRMFVSNPAVVGVRLDELGDLRRLGVTVSRIRRGDVDLLARGDTVLQPGDRVRVVGPRERLQDAARLFGDSYRALGEVDIMSFGLGLALGLLVGAIAVPLPGGITFRLGFAGGPLIVALALGAMGRTGPVAWQLPYSANLTLRQLGMVLFLAGIGTRAGQAFASAVGDLASLAIIAAGALVTCAVALVTLVVGYRVAHVPMGVLLGMLAGIQTQPAVLAFAVERTADDLPNVGYATVFPVALISKIVLAQVVLAALG
jgi:putative transport protein